MSIKIAFLVPVYNVENYLEDCINSIFKQDLKDFQIFIIDDCSTDRSYEIAQQFARQHPQITLIRNPQNLGIGQTRNVGLAAIKASQQSFDFVCFLDSDDVLIPGALQKIFANDHYRQAQIIACSFKYWYKDNSTEVPLFTGKESLSKEQFADALISHRPQEIIYTLIGNKIFSYDLIKNESFDSTNRYAEDWDFMVCKLMPKIQKVHISQTPLFLYRMRKSSLSNNSSNHHKISTLHKSEFLSNHISKRLLQELVINQLNLRRNYLSYVATHDDFNFEPELSVFRKELKGHELPLKYKFRFFKYFLPIPIVKYLLSQRFYKLNQRQNQRVHQNPIFFE